MDVLMSLNHDGKLSDFLHKSFISKSLCDLKIVTSDQAIYQAHRVVLAAFSDFFCKKIKQKRESYNMKIQIEVNSNVFKVLLEFMYTGQLSVATADRVSLYQATNLLEMDSAQELLQNAYTSTDWTEEFKSPIQMKNSTAIVTAEEEAEIKTESFVDRDDTMNLKSTPSKMSKVNRRGLKPSPRKNIAKKKNESSRKKMKQHAKELKNKTDDGSGLGSRLNDLPSSSVENLYPESSENVEEVVKPKRNKDPDFIPSQALKSRTSILTRTRSAMKSVSENKKKTLTKAVPNTKTSKKPKNTVKQSLKIDHQNHRAQVQKKEKSNKQKLVKKKGQIKVYYPVGMKEFHCTACKKMFTASSSLQKHLITEHNTVPISFFWTRLMLNKVIIDTREKNLIRKIDNKKSELYCHDDDKSKERFQCSICNKKFKFYCFGKMHLKKCHFSNIERKRYGIFKNVSKFMMMRRQMFQSTKAFKETKTGKSQYWLYRRKFTNCIVCKNEITVGRNYAYHLKKLHSMSEEEARGISGYPKVLPQYKQTTCPECNIKFENTKKFGQHIREVHALGDTSFPCPDCENKYTSLSALKSHMRWIHRKDGAEISKSIDALLKCEVEGCTFTSGNMVNLKNHVMQNHPGLEYKCSECGFTFHVKAMLNRHMIVKHLKKKEYLKYTCEYCGKKMSKRGFLNMHVFKEHGVNIGEFKVYKCTFEGCEKECATKSSLNSHLKRHNKEKRFKCPYCSQMLKTEVTYRKHINKMHLGIRPHLCQICGQTFGEESELLSHIKNRHSTEKEFQCEHCPYATANKSTFYTHLFMVHKVRAHDDNRTEYNCPHCDFSTVLGHRYRTHLNGHKNIREYRCNFCSKDFISSSALRSHKQWAHSDKKYSCSHCGYSTKTTQKLNEHIRIQHQLKGFKPYHCPYCSFSCATGGNTRKHIKQKHKGQEVRYIRDDSLLEAARIARKSGNTMSLSALPAQQSVATSTPSTFELQEYMTIPTQTEPKQKPETIINVIETQTATANLVQNHQVSQPIAAFVPSHSVYKLVSGPEVPRMDRDLTGLPQALPPMQSNIQANFVEVSEIPLHDNVIVSSGQLTLQPLVNVMHNTVQHL